MKKTLAFLFAIGILFSACQVEPGQDTSNLELDFDQYFENISKIDNCFKKGESFEILGKRLDAGIKAPLDTLNSVTTLKALYYDAIKRHAVATPRTDDRCADTYIAVKERTLQRLGIINNEEAMNVVLDIYKDDQLTLSNIDIDGLIRVMIQFGEPILSKLEPIKDKHPEISTKVIPAVKASTSY